MENAIVPSIIATSPDEVANRIEKVKDYFKVLQLDVMDGKFVPTHSLDFEFRLPETDCSYEAHLMVSDPSEWIKKNFRMADVIIAHLESCKDIKNVIELVKSKGKKAGIAINPETNVDAIKPYLGKVDEVLVMTVNPGYYGSKFLPETLEKVKELRKLKPKLNIEVDGGINSDNIKQAYGAGANLFVSGSYLQKSDDVKKAKQNLEMNFV